MREELYLKAAALESGVSAAWCEGVDPVEFMLPVARGVVRKALDGDVAAAKEVVDSVYGRVEGGDDVGVRVVPVFEIRLVREDVEGLVLGHEAREPGAREPAALPGVVGGENV